MKSSVVGVVGDSSDLGSSSSSDIIFSWHVSTCGLERETETLVHCLYQHIRSGLKLKSIKSPSPQSHLERIYFNWAITGPTFHPTTVRNQWIYLHSVHLKMRKTFAQHAPGRRLPSKAIPFPSPHHSALDSAKQSFVYFVNGGKKRREIKPKPHFMRFSAELFILEPGLGTVMAK